MTFITKHSINLAEQNIVEVNCSGFSASHVSQNVPVHKVVYCYFIDTNNPLTPPGAQPHCPQHATPHQGGLACWPCLLPSPGPILPQQRRPFPRAPRDPLGASSHSCAPYPDTWGYQWWLICSFWFTPTGTPQEEWGQTGASRLVCTPWVWLTYWSCFASGHRQLLLKKSLNNLCLVYHVTDQCYLWKVVLTVGYSLQEEQTCGKAVGSMGFQELLW